MQSAKCHYLRQSTRPRVARPSVAHSAPTRKVACRWSTAPKQPEKMTVAPAQQDEQLVLLRKVCVGF
jgi:hypothetical protein